MSLPLPTYVSGDFTVATAISPAVFEAPFPGVNKDYILNQDFQQFRNNFVSLDLDTPHPEFPDFILVQESPMQNMNGGIVKWTRTYAKIPDLRLEGRSIAYQLPGLSAGGTNMLTTVSSINADFNAQVVTVNTQTAHGFTAGDKAFFFWQQITNNQQQQFFTQQTIATTPTANQFTVVYIPLAAAVQLVYVQKAMTGSFGNFGRRPITQTVWGESKFEYFNEAFMTDIPILTPTVIYDALGQVVDTYGTATTPLLQTYQSQISGGQLIVAQASVIRRWLGNIYERETVLVRAQ